jgi:hypothetical protein
LLVGMLKVFSTELNEMTECAGARTLCRENNLESRRGLIGAVIGN